MSDLVKTEVVGQVLVITLDHPKANAINLKVSEALYAAFQRLEGDPSLRVGILTGAGQRFFCAGSDLKAAAAGESLYSDHGPGGYGGFTEWFGRTKPVIAAINGLAYGGGVELALAADLVIAADHAEFALPEVHVGAVASIALVYLPRRVPQLIARELLLTGRRASAVEAAGWGLVNRVVPGPELMSAALALAEEVCVGAPLAIAAVLEGIDATAALSIEEGFQLLGSGQLRALDAVGKSEDLVEGPRAFVEKRAPRWLGR